MQPVVCALPDQMINQPADRFYRFVHIILSYHP